MTDKEFQKEIGKLSRINSAYKSQLKKVEDEIFDRHGAFPSDVDFDEFIDTFHIGTGSMSVKEIDAGMMELTNRQSPIF